MSTAEHTTPGTPPLLSLPEVAMALRCSVPTCRRLISRGELGALKICGQIRVAVDEVERLLDASRVAREDRAPGADAQTTEAAGAGTPALHPGHDEQED
jgi:excisionase family DNA binding protein